MEVGFICPPLASRAERLARHLAEWLSGAPAVHLAVHSDFSDSQVLIHGGEVAIVDLDSARYGDPADDLGGILSQMEAYVLSGKLTLDRSRDAREALLQGYPRAPSGSPVDRIRPYTAAGLLRRARFAFRSRKPDWQRITGSTLERAEAVLNRRG